MNGTVIGPVVAPPESNATPTNGAGAKAAPEKIRARGGLPFLALSPDTPVEAVLPWLGMIDGVTLMTVYPGFAGQQMVPGSLERITALRELLDRTEGMPIGMLCPVTRAQIEQLRREAGGAS